MEPKFSCYATYPPYEAEQAMKNQVDNHIPNDVQISEEDENTFVTYKVLKNLLRYVNIKPNSCNVAVENGDLQTVKILQSLGHVVDDASIDVATNKGHWDVVMHLTLEKTDENMNHGQFVTACINGNIEVIKFMCDYNEQYGIANESDMNLGILFACKNGHLNVVEYLHSRGVKVTKLMLAYSKDENLTKFINDNLVEEHVEEKEEKDEYLRSSFLSRGMSSLNDVFDENNLLTPEVIKYKGTLINGLCESYPIKPINFNVDPQV